MNRRSLGIVAIILIVLMAVVASAGLDDLPRNVRQSVTAAAGRVAADRTAFAQNREFIERAVRDEPALFAAKAGAWHDRLEQDSSRLQAVAAAVASAQQLAQANRRTDADKIERALGESERMREVPSRDVAEIRADVERWLSYKRELPRRLESMRTAHEQLVAFDVDSNAAPARKAMIDWPDKRADLEGRLEGLKKLQAEGEQVWTSTAAVRTAAENGDLTHIDYAALFGNADRLEAINRELPAFTAALNTLAGQLYVTRDKLLLDVDERARRERLRVVNTRFPDATLNGGQTTSEERWVEAPAGPIQEAERSVGMVVERKPAGKYDSEAERVVQPPAYAYVAPPGQSNSYGSWAGGVWTWLPQYLILSQLLHASRGPVTTADYDAYDRARRRGETFYGRNNEFRPRWTPRGDVNVPRPGGLRGIFGRAREWSRPREDSTFSRGGSGPSSNPSSGGWWKERPKPSWGERSYGGSQYQNRGTYGGSRYQSRGTFGSRPYSRGFGGAARSFGRGGRR